MNRDSQFRVERCKVRRADTQGSPGANSGWYASGKGNGDRIQRTSKGEGGIQLERNC